jgi:hypothetical protein
MRSETSVLMISDDEDDDVNGIDDKSTVNFGLQSGKFKLIAISKLTMEPIFIYFETLADAGDGGG